MLFRSSPVNSTYHTIQLDNTNSNIVAMVENLPEKISYDLNFNLNPLGNASGHHDFLYTDDLFDANLKVIFPLRFAASQLMFADTQDLATIDPSGDENLGDGSLTLLADIGFPYEFNIQLFALNENNQATDSLFVPDRIAPASLDNNFRAIGQERTIIRIPLTVSRRKNLLGSKRIAIRARFSTSNYPQQLQVYSDYVLNLKLIGDFTYLIR